MPRDLVNEVEQLGELARAENARQIFPSMKAPVDPVLEKLTAARAEIVVGWCQCKFNNGEGGHCIEGALTAAGVLSRSAVHDALIAAIPAAYVEKPELRNINLMLFNDHPDTQKADVLALFDRAIAARRGA